MRNGGWLGTIQPPQSSGGIITPNKLWPGQGGGSGPVVPAAIHFWPMNEGTGSTFVDHIGTTNLTATNVTWAVTSGLGASSVAQFNGTTASASAAAVDSTLNFSGTQPMTVAVWAKINADNSSTIFGNLQTSSSFQGWEVGLSGNAGAAPPTLLVVGAVTTNQMTALGPAAAGTSSVLLVWTYSGNLALSGVQMYINGVNQTPLSDGSGTLTSGSTSTSPVFVGARNNSSNFFSGALAYMRVWNQVLTQAQISLLFSQGPQ